MSKTKAYITLSDLAKGLGMDRTNLKRLIKKLEIEPKEIRGKMNQWTQAFSTSDIDSILLYRDGISHNLIKSTDGSYKLGDV